MDLSGRTILVAGASSGIGAGFARKLGAAGARVVLGARRLDRVEALATELPEAVGVQLDITDEASVIAAYDAAEARFGTVQGILANAGVGTGGRSTDTTVEGLKTIIDTNLLGS